MILKFYLFFYVLLLISSSSAISEVCTKTNSHLNNNCKWLNKVVGIKTPIMIASGTIISKNIIVTNKHVVEDHDEVLLKFFNGEIKKAYPIPNDYPVDLVFLSLNKKFNSKSIIIDLKINEPKSLNVIGFDQGRNKIRIYKKGKIISYPDLNKHPYARIHTTAQSFPGNSGGAVIDENSNLVGFLASGDGNINEVIPVQNIAYLKTNSNISKLKQFKILGKNIRVCADTLDFAYKFEKNPPEKLKNKIEKYCFNSKNKQLLDQAGQTFGRWGKIKKSISFFKESILLDPKSPNTLLSLAISYHIKRDIISEKPIIEELLKLIPENPQVLRLGIQVAGFLKDKKLADTTLKFMEKYNRESIPLAKNFLKNAFK